ncbi:MAG: asparagine synthetase B, partial [Actinobacteria bacterium]|nr:asparagine synthetase B [Actinomycetota bacterium]
RTPFLHRELAELAASIPASTHVAGGGKRLLRQVLREVMPDARYARGKIAFRTPTADWLRGPLAPALTEQLESSALYDDGWIDRGAVRRALAEHREGRVDWSRLLWPVLVLGSWMDHFGERPAG